jgi:hypothetical protein
MLEVLRVGAGTRHTPNCGTAFNLIRKGTSLHIRSEVSCSAFNSFFLKMKAKERLEQASYR